MLNYEAMGGQTTLMVTVRCTDQHKLSITKNLTVQVEGIMHGESSS